MYILGTVQPLHTLTYNLVLPYVTSTFLRLDRILTDTPSTAASSFSSQQSKMCLR